MMTSAQAMEEELQQSVLRSEDAGWELNDGGTGQLNINAVSGHINGTIFIAPNGIIRAQSGNQIDGASDRDASGEELLDEAEENEREEEGEEEEEEEEEQEEQEDEEDEEEEDASGEEDFDLLQTTPANMEAHNLDSQSQSQSDEDGVDEDASGEDDEDVIGAVKIQPGSLADEMEEDEDSDVSEAPSAIEDDDDSDEDEEGDEGVWEDARNMATERDEEDDSDIGPSNVCIFCKQDEEHDPSEDFEAYLACADCGDNAHQQCAREKAALSEGNSPKKWKCPECYTRESDIEMNENEASDDEGRPESTHSDVPRMARDLLAVPIGSDDGDAHSVFNELVLQEDPGDGSRLLRKRKTSSAEPDEAAIAVRKRRRNASMGTNDGEAADSVNPSETGGPRSARTPRQKAAVPAPVSVERKSRTALVMKIHVKPGNLKEVLGRKKRGRRVPGGAAARTPKRNDATPARVNMPPMPALMETPFAAESYAQPYYSFFDRETDDAKGKPYGGILAEAEADTSKTLPAPDDRNMFDQAKQKAEDEWRSRILAMQTAAEAPSRKHKRIIDHASQIECIEFGGWEIDTWYAAPYPAEYSRNRVLYICEFCLKYMNSDYVAWRHKLKCATKHPPGDEIYRDGIVSMFEVDGRKNPEYCQNLCLLAKLFLGSKTLYYDVEPFLFYVLCEFDECGYHFVGYFSKEKRSSSQNNVSCILTLPIHQRKGYGNLLIDFSYLLTRVEEKTGSPEKPLSDMGLVSYRNYWRLVICQTFVNMVDASDYKHEGLSIDQISKKTGLTQDDVISALEGLRALVRDPQTKTYALRVDIDYCRDYVAKWKAKGYVKLNPDKLAWTPYVMGRGVATQFELGPISTIAPREGEEEEARVVDGLNRVGAETYPLINGAKGLAQAQQMTEVEDEREQSAPTSSTSETPKTDGEETEENKENAGPVEVNGNQLDEESNGTNWRLAYDGILPTRFEIFPAVNGGRRSDRSRQSLSRPTLPQAPSSISRPRPKRPAGSARRVAAARPKSSTSRRKTGGTGRGPGRWPKGTKKADYGNADSGPGFPPGWREKQKAGAEVQDPSALASKEEGSPQDEVQVFVAVAETNGAAIKGNGGGLAS